MEELQSKFDAKILSLPTNEENYFAILHIGSPVGNKQFASFLGFAMRKEDDDGVYFMILEEEQPEDNYPVVMMAFHEDVVEESDIPWEVFRDKMDGKFKTEYA